MDRFKNFIKRKKQDGASEVNGQRPAIERESFPENNERGRHMRLALEQMIQERESRLDGSEQRTSALPTAARHFLNSFRAYGIYLGHDPSEKTLFEALPNDHVAQKTYRYLRDYLEQLLAAVCAEEAGKSTKRNLEIAVYNVVNRMNREFDLALKVSPPRGSRE